MEAIKKEIQGIWDELQALKRFQEREVRELREMIEHNQAMTKNNTKSRVRIIKTFERIDESIGSLSDVVEKCIVKG